MSEKQHNDWEWNVLPPLPYDKFSQPVCINPDEFIIALWNELHYEGDGMYKFNTINNEWLNLVSYPLGSKYDATSLAYDKHNNVIYMSNSWECNQVDLNIHTITTAAFHAEDSQIVSIGHKIHAIGNRLGDKKEYVVNEGFNELKKHRIVYLQSTNSILCLGRESTYGILESIHEFNLSSQKWSKLDTQLPEKLYDFGFVKTTSEDFIILLGGVGIAPYDVIRIYDVRQSIFVQSKIKTPTKGNCKAVLMSNPDKDKTIIIGFIRDCYKRDDFNQVQTLSANFGAVVIKVVY